MGHRKGAMIRKRTQRDSDNISLDSLVDIFMNVLGILMLTAIFLAISQPESSKNKRITEKKLTSEKEPHDTNILYLAEAHDVDTVPFYFHLSSEGVRPVDPSRVETSSPFFNISENGTDSTLLPAPGQVIRSIEYDRFISSISARERHIVFLVDRLGVSHYRTLRQKAVSYGIESGWIPWEQPLIRLTTSGGTTINSVQ